MNKREGGQLALVPIKLFLLQPNRLNVVRDFLLAGIRQSHLLTEFRIQDSGFIQVLLDKDFIYRLLQEGLHFEQCQPSQSIVAVV